MPPESVFQPSKPKPERCGEVSATDTVAPGSSTTIAGAPEPPFASKVNDAVSARIGTVVVVVVDGGTVVVVVVVGTVVVVVVVDEVVVVPVGTVVVVLATTEVVVVSGAVVVVSGADVLDVVVVAGEEVVVDDVLVVGAVVVVDDAGLTAGAVVVVEVLVDVADSFAGVANNCCGSTPGISSPPRSSVSRSAVSSVVGRPSAGCSGDRTPSESYVVE